MVYGIFIPVHGEIFFELDYGFNEGFSEHT